MLGLVVKSPWIELILDGKKTWEIRGRSTNIRERIALIKSKSGKVFGTCQVTGCVGPLTLEELRSAADKHQIPLERLEVLPYPVTYAWVVSCAKSLPEPIPYKHPAGAVIWVRLEGQDEPIRQALGGGEPRP